MTRDEATAIIAEERLSNYVWFEKPHNKADAVAIYLEGDTWFVVNTDERAVMGAVRSFDTELEALDLFIKRLRLSKLL